MGALLLRALNRNQLLILEYAFSKQGCSISSLLRFIGIKERIPLSTLKLNAKVLKSLNLIDFCSGKNDRSITITEAGQAVRKLVNRNNFYD